MRDRLGPALGAIALTLLIAGGMAPNRGDLAGPATVGGTPLGGEIRSDFTATGAQTYAVTFTQTGLSVDTTWVVNLTGGLTESSDGSSLVVQLPNGTYNYTINRVAGHWVPEPGSGSIPVSGAATGVTVAFTYAYPVSIDRPAGIASEVLWSVTFAGTDVLPAVRGPAASTTATTDEPILVLYEPNGSYTFLVTDSDKASYQDAGSTTVAGHAITIVPAPIVPPRHSNLLLIAVTGALVGAGAVGIALTLWWWPRRPSASSARSENPRKAARWPVHR